jgi:hypothetical protein
VNDIDRENSLSVHNSTLCQFYQQSHLVANQEDLDQGNDGFYLQNIPFCNVP